MRFFQGAVLALCIGVGALGLALPASAATVATCQKSTVRGPGGVPIDRVQAFAGTIKMQLRQMGYNVSRVDPWGGCVRATIEDGGGREHMQFFDPDTLEPLTTR